MNQRYVVPFSYLLVIAAFGFTIYTKATNSGDMVALSLICLFTQILFCVAAVRELRGSRHFPETERSGWAAFLFSVPLIGGFIYMTTVRIRFVL